MPEYKTNYYQMQELLEYIINGYVPEDIQQYQGYMSIYLRKDDGTDEPITRIIDMEII